VMFGRKDNHRHEPIWFEVVDLNSPYHALLGRPALAKFMAVPHYAYLKMKLPGPRGVITVTGCYKKSLECARASLSWQRLWSSLRRSVSCYSEWRRTSRAARHRASQLLISSRQAAPRKSRPKWARR
jgi:hypothetical protein